MQNSTIVSDLERVDRLERLRDHVKAVDGGGGGQLVLVHPPHQRGGAPPRRGKDGLAAEEKRRDGELPPAEGAERVLHRRRRRVRPALDLEAGEARLQRPRRARELPSRLSRRAELDAQHAVALLDGGEVVVGDDAEGGEVELRGLVVRALEQGGEEERGGEREEKFVRRAEATADSADAPR
eukprot:CAMPEP_0182820850 /NCGR_PEP_ID=MMETSP0006_2-20121128/13348_1 /TAXON_ID=97485 /ORGANISM="Prymnesium parvum, Strain Texoma1" /LENGTH=181 /DNA_ID=CAMNT_0024947551 /DNA_START=322 /DNA_END=864 /DNA_ORIENTATION=-